MKQVCVIFIKALLILSALTLISGCNDEETIAAGGGTLGGGSGGGNTGGGGTDPQQSTYRMGTGNGDSFVEGGLNITVETLSAGASTSISVNVVDQNGSAYTGTGEVSFISNCISQGLAEIETPASLENGRAVTNYTATGCSGTDMITASVTINDQNLTATGTLTVATAELGAIAFVSAEPESIAVKGSGLQETSLVTFKVTDKTGSPIADQNVTFSLDTNVGNLDLSSTTDTSGADGLVSTIVQAGTVPTPVTVVATVVDTSISATSNGLSVGTTIADDDSFSLAVENFAPEGAGGIDGLEIEITVHLSDRFNNPVPDGTTINFTTEGGNIGSTCQTVDGECLVIWTSSNPRPADNRSTIMAYTIGEESFVDDNGDLVFQAGDETYTKVGEPFRDDDETGFDGDSMTPGYTSGDQLIDTVKDGVYTPPDNLFNGLLCEDKNGATAPNCPTDDSDKTLTIWSDTVILMATRQPIVTLQDSTQSNINVSGGLVTVNFVISDSSGAGNAPPSGTTFSVSTTNGEIIAENTADFDGTTYNAIVRSVTIGGDGTPSSGSLVFEAKSAAGNTNSVIVSVDD